MNTCAWKHCKNETAGICCSKRCRNKYYVDRRRKRLKKMAVEYKGGKCEQCGYSKSATALQFHHLDPSQKDFGIASSGYTRAWEKIRAELDKCVMLCANCHAEEHERLGQ